MEPLRIQAKRLASEPSTRRSAPSKPDIAALAARFVEPLRGEAAASPPAVPTPAAASGANRSPASEAEADAQPSLREPPAAPIAQGRAGLSRNALIAALVVLALIPLAILIVQLWPDMTRPRTDSGVPLAKASRATETVLPKKETARLEPAAPAEVTAVKTGAADVTGSLPHGATGWSLAPDNAGALPFWVPSQSGAPEMNLGLAPATPETSEQADQPGAVAAVPTPRRKTEPPAETEPAVRTVKVVTIKPPREKKPYDGAYALGAPADEPDASAEWMVTKTAVDMHAKAEQKSETVKIAQGGLKVRVTARDKRWVQVTDPKSATTGWIYDRFLKPADAPAQ